MGLLYMYMYILTSCGMGTESEGAWSLLDGYTAQQAVPGNSAIWLEGENKVINNDYG